MLSSLSSAERSWARASHSPIAKYRLGELLLAGIRLSEPGVAPEHCVVRPSPAGHRLTDRRSASGTYVNGMRVTEQDLAPGDQVAIGDIVLLYRNESAPERDSTARNTLLRACSFLFLFRALASAKDQPHRAAFEAQLSALALADIVPCTASAILMGRTKRSCAPRRKMALLCREPWKRSPPPFPAREP